MARARQSCCSWRASRSSTRRARHAASRCSLRHLSSRRSRSSPPSLFLNRPLSLVLIILGALIICSPLLKLRKPKALMDDPET